MRKKLHIDFLKKWHIAADCIGIPKEFYNNVKVRFIKDPTNKCKYTFGVVYNPSRIKRFGTNKKKIRCHMCRMVKEVEENPLKNLFPNYDLKGFIATPNEFPSTEGSVLLIARQEKPMYDTNNLEILGVKGEILDRFFKFGNEFGFNIFHQTVGAGATIGNHEHFHATTLYKNQEKAGKKFGFDNARIENIKGIKGVYTMPDFPYAHLIFEESDPEKIIYFLKKLKYRLKSPLQNNSIPHTLSQGEKGILITPLKIDVGISMGSERAPGYFEVLTKDDYNKVNYKYIMEFMKKRFYEKDVGLEKLL